VNNENITKNDHMLNNADIGTYDTTADKMNAKSTAKICSQNVIDLLSEHVLGSEGTCAYLQLMRYLHDAFIEPSTSSLDRLYKAFYGLIFVRVWRNNLQKNESCFFISNQLWTCLELNVAFLYYLVKKGLGHLILVWSSQPCEEMFRTLRSLTSHNLTQINFNFLEAMQKLNRIEKIQEVAFELKDEFILEENLKLKSDVVKKHNISISHPTIHECHSEISRAYDDVIKTCEGLNMKKLFPCNPDKFLKKPPKRNLVNPSENVDESLSSNDEDDDEDFNDEVETVELEDVENIEVNERKIIKAKNIYFLDEDSSIFKKLLIVKINITRKFFL
jgi:hypothetical protein